MCVCMYVCMSLCTLLGYNKELTGYYKPNILPPAVHVDGSYVFNRADPTVSCSLPACKTLPLYKK